MDPERPRDPGGCRLDPTEAALVEQMFDWYLEPGTTINLVAKRLSDLAVHTPTGKLRWNRSTVHGILTNPAYTGTAYANRSRTVPAKQRKSAMLPIGPEESHTPRPCDEWIPILVPAVISREVIERVQAKLALNQQMAPRNNKTHEYFLRGLISCGRCRLSTIGRISHNRYRYYVCRGHGDALRAAKEQRCLSRYMPADQLDELVWQVLCLVLTQSETITHALERAHGGHWVPQ